MKKILAITLFSSLLMIMAFSSAKAYTFTENSGLKEMGDSTELSSSGALDPEVYVGTILTLVFSFLGIIFLVLTIYAGINWMTAQGDASQVTKAKETLIRAIVGLVIVLAAYGITYFVMSAFQKNQTVLDTPINNDSGQFDYPQA